MLCAEDGAVGAGRQGGLRRAGRSATILLALAAALAGALGGGCTGDEAGPLGADLPDGPDFDTLLVPLELDLPDAYGRITVTDANVPLDSSQVLYIGRQGSERSSLLARYDLSTFSDPFWNGVAFTTDNIQAVTLRLFMLKYYIDLLPPVAKRGLIKRYEVYELADTLDPGLYPGPEPAVSSLLVGQDDVAAGAAVQLVLPEQAFLRWRAAGAHTGIMVAEGVTVDSQPGFIGFASKEMKLAGTTLEPEIAGTVVGPILAVQFLDPDTTVVLVPRDDISTFSALDSLPDSVADGLVLRTHLRSDPFLSFSLADLPAGSIINRAILTVTSDTLRSYGPPEAVVCCEVAASALPALDNPYALEDLPAHFKAVTGITGADPPTARRLRFIVTTTLQRWANGVYAEPLRFALLPSEDFLSAYDMGSVDPDFYLSRFWFYGTAAADSLDRPRLEIVYTPPVGSAGGGR